MRPRLAAAGLILAMVIGGLVVGVRGSGLATGPVPIVWDRQPCAHCHMLIGEPSFAAQLQLRDGRVLDFDDAGCLLRHLTEERTPIHAVWFHHLSEDRWLSAEEVAFRRVLHTPMGSGLAAVGRAELHEVELDEASRVVSGGAP
jgi:copper chaperone NosL